MGARLEETQELNPSEDSEPNVGVWARNLPWGVPRARAQAAAVEAGRTGGRAGGEGGRRGHARVSGRRPPRTKAPTFPEEDLLFHLGYYVPKSTRLANMPRVLPGATRRRASLRRAKVRALTVPQGPRRKSSRLHSPREPQGSEMAEQGHEEHGPDGSRVASLG